MNDKYSFLTVTQVNEYIKMLFDSNAVLKTVFGKGEISNFNYQYKTGHMYFTLKDEGSMISVAMFASSASRLAFKPTDGMKVIVKGRISTYVQRGVYQIYADDMQPDGIGALTVAFEQLKRKLTAEGLFDEDRKRALPQMPKRIGIITSPTGAAVRDMINILKRRFPLVEVLLYPSLVQGDGAPEQLVRGLECFNKRCPVDLIIIGRGGGSIEDLWSFNDEKVVRAVASSNTPVVSAVGHQTDFTLCDFAADLRAPTPSAAAELAVPESDAVVKYLNSLIARSGVMLERQLSTYKTNLKYLSEYGILSSKTRLLDERKMTVLNLSGALAHSSDKVFQKAKIMLAQKASKLTALNPLAVLGRGYSVAANGEGKVLLSVSDTSLGDNITVRLSDGSLDAKVSAIKNNK